MLRGAPIFCLSGLVPWQRWPHGRWISQSNSIGDRKRTSQSKSYFLSRPTRGVQGQELCVCVFVCQSGRPNLPSSLPTLMPAWATSSEVCLSVWVSRWVGRGLSLCAHFCVGCSVEKSPHSLSLFLLVDYISQEGRGPGGWNHHYDEACDSRPRPLCLDNYNQHSEPWKCLVTRT